MRKRKTALTHRRRESPLPSRRREAGDNQHELSERKNRGQGFVVTGTLSLSASAATTKRLLFRPPLGCAPGLGSAHAAGLPGSCSLRETRSHHVGAGLANREGGRALTLLYLLYPSSISTLSCEWAGSNLLTSYSVILCVFPRPQASSFERNLRLVSLLTSLCVLSSTLQLLPPQKMSLLQPVSLSSNQLEVFSGCLT